MFFNKLKSIPLATALVASLFIFSGSSYAHGPIVDVSFSDSNLQDCITEQAQANNWVTTSQMTSLSCHDRNISTLDGIEQLTSLKSLNLIINDIEDITPLSGLTNLTGLGLWDNKVKDIIPLANLKALQGLTLGYNDISDITPLAELDKLTSLSLHFNEVSDLSGLRNLTRLKKLTLQNNQITDVSFLHRLTGLNELNLTNNDYLYCERVDALKQVLTATVITDNCTQTPLISDIAFVDANLQQCMDGYLQDFTKVTDIKRFRCISRDVETLDGLEYFIALEDLNLSRNNITTITQLANLARLKRLNLRHNQITDIAPLSQLNAIFNVVLTDNKVEDISPLSTLSSLLQLSLEDNNISQIPLLPKLRNLYQLALDGNNIADISPLSTLGNLKDLSLKGNNITDISPLAVTQKLQKLDLSSNQIKDISTLEGLKNLSTVSFTVNKLDDLTPLHQLPALKYVNVKHNSGISCAKIDALLAVFPALRINQNCHDFGPVVDAGPDMTINEQNQITLKGQTSDPEGDDTTILWLQTSGPLALIPDNMANQNILTLVTPPVNQTEVLTFQLNAYDASGLTASDSVNITVTVRQDKPTINAGVDLTVEAIANVRLTGSAHSDTSTITDKTWTQTQGPEVQYRTSNGIDNTIYVFFKSPDVQQSQTVVFELTATDDNGLSNSDLLTVNIIPTHNVPVAMAGPDQRVNEQTTFLNYGYGTTPRDYIKSHHWQQASGISVTIADPTDSKLEFATPKVTQPEVLQFILTVTNKADNSDSDTIELVVLPVNLGPKSNAGNNQVALAQSQVTLNGMAADADGSITDYQWTQTSGATVQLTNSNNPTATFRAPEVDSPQTLTFTLSVTDNEGAKASDSMTVYVNPVADNLQAIASQDQTVEQGTTVTLSGTQSMGDISQYLWQQTDGPTVVLSNASSATTTFTAPVISQAETLNFRLTVYNGNQNAQVDLVSITINLPPTVNAGSHQVFSSEQIVSLEGQANDVDGSISHYQWSQTRGTPVQLQDAQSATASFTAPQVVHDEVLTFELHVTDNHGSTTHDSVDVSVIANNLISQIDFADVIMNWCVDYYSYATDTISQMSSLHCGDFGDLDGYQFSGIGDLSGLEQLTALEGLYFYLENKYSDLNPIAQLPVLERLALNSSELLDLSPLTQLKRLTYLDIKSQSLTDISPIAQMSNLKTLLLDTPNFNDLPSFDGLNQLTYLRLKLNKTIDWSTVALLTSLEGLSLTSAEIADISALKSLTKLQSLDLSRNNISDISVLANFPLLSDFSLGDNEISDITVLANFKHDPILNLWGNRVSDIIPQTSGASMIDFAHVTQLNLSSNRINSTASMVNADFTNLHELDLQTNQIDDISGLDTLQNLEVINLNLNNISDLTPLSELQKLSVLKLENNSVSDLTPLYGLTNLGALYVKNNAGLKCEQIEALTAKITAYISHNCQNQQPTVNAGFDQVVDEQTQVTLSATSSDDAGISRHLWRQMSGIDVRLLDASQSAASFTGPALTEQAVLVFEVWVFDGDGGISRDTVTVTVNPVNATPLVNVGPDQLLDGQTQVILSADASDIDGNITHYQWQQTTGTTVNLDDFNSAIATFTAPQISTTEVLSFSMCVTDNEQAVACDNVAISINPVSDTVSANAGQDQAVNEQVLVTLLGTGASTSTGTIARFQWTQVSGTAVSLTDANLPTASFIAPGVAQSQTLIFALTATDNNGASDGDYVAITVNPIAEEPTVDAGINQSVLGLATVMLIATASDNDGTINSYQWQQTSGPFVTLENADSATANFTAMAVDQTGLLSFKVTVTDNEGNTSTATTDVTINTNVQISNINFIDEAFRSCVIEIAQANQWISSDEVTVLDCTNQNINDLGGIEHFSQLVTLQIAHNIELTDIRSLFGIDGLQRIDLTGNNFIGCGQLATLSQLFISSNLTKPGSCQTSGVELANITLVDANLNNCLTVSAQLKQWTRAEQVTALSCENANVSELSGLENFSGLTQLDLSGNAISDISPVASLEYLTALDLADNPFNDIAALFDLTLTPQSIDLTGNNQLSCAQLNFVDANFGAGVVLHDDCSNDIVEGRLKWRIQAKNEGYSDMALGQNNTLYFVNIDHQLKAINSLGVAAWRFDIKGTAITPRIAVDGTIYVLSSDGNLYAINPDGSQKWLISPWQTPASTRAIAGDGTIYVANEKNLYAINPDGSQKWMKTLDADVGVVRVGASGQLFIGQSNNTLSLNSDGNKLWSAFGGDGGDSIGNNDTLYYFTISETEAFFGGIASDGTRLFGFGESDLWTGAPVISAQGTVFGSNVFTGLSIPSESGGASIVFNPPNIAFCTPAVGNDDVLYVTSVDRATNTGRFYAVNSVTGNEKWSIDSNNSMCNSPLIGSDGTVYFKDAGGILYAVETNSNGLANSPWPKSESNNRNTNSVNQ